MANLQNMSCNIINGDPTPAPERAPRSIITAKIGDIEINIYESLITPGVVVIDVDVNENEGLKIAVNDEYVHEHNA